MGKIIYLMGKSSTGKDTIYKELRANKRLALKAIIPYTTRPIRAGEQNGREYIFTDEGGFGELLDSGKVIEHREYHTFHGLWRYFTVDDGQIDLESHDYIMIGTLESYHKIMDYYGKPVLLPILIELDDGERLQRALNRERAQTNPRYEEMCRRFLADSEDFEAGKMAAAGIERTFCNDELSRCLCEIEDYIAERIRR